MSGVKIQFFCAHESSVFADIDIIQILMCLSRHDF